MNAIAKRLEVRQELREIATRPRQPPQSNCHSVKTKFVLDQPQQLPPALPAPAENDGGFQKPMDYWIGAMAFTPDAKLLITGSRDQRSSCSTCPTWRNNGR